MVTKTEACVKYFSQRTVETDVNQSIYGNTYVLKQLFTDFSNNATLTNNYLTNNLNE